MIYKSQILAMPLNCLRAWKSNQPIQIPRGMRRQNPIMRLDDSTSAQKLAKHCTMLTVFFHIREEHQQHVSGTAAGDTDVGATSVFIFGVRVLG